ncbi:ABC transporter substrate-binding protein, partial [Desulfobacterales bacterium HSG17]|nr:ABC transporter substrate-binding protein [Desulfobacterales bacterium HSG17]
MEKSRNKTKVLQITLFVALVFGSQIMAMGICSAQEDKPKYGGTLRIISWGGDGGFDVIKSRAPFGVGADAGHRVMETLFDLGPKGELIPVLGLSATPSQNGKIWTIKLRKGVKFHDGTPFNADAVVFHWKRILDPENRIISRIVFQPILAVEKIGDYEVQFKLQHAWLPFTAILTNPKGFISPIPSPKAVKEGIQNHSPVGTGPFIFKEWKRGDRIVLTKNTDYWQKGKPYLDGIVFLMVLDHETRYAALLSGQADMIGTDWET